MAPVVTERCVNCRYTYCAVVCPVDCFWELKSPAMLVIDPNECTDCRACVPECPVNAIWPDHEVPAAVASWTDFNANEYRKGTQVTAGTDPLPTAKSLEDIQADELARGLAIFEPTNAS